MKILVVGAHYDDFEIGCGGTIAKYLQNGDDVYIAITSSDEYLTGDPRVRLYEQKQVLKMMGIEHTKLLLFSYKQEIRDIVGELDIFKPDIVFTQCENDTHQDHKRASIIGQAVGRKRETTVVFYDSGSAYDFHPSVFSVIDFEEKMTFLKCYQSQINSDSISLDIIKRKDHYWASLITKKETSYAEGFVVRKMDYKI